MLFKSTAVANEIIKYHKTQNALPYDLTISKLIKMLYFINFKHFLKYKKPLYEDLTMINLYGGPLYEEVYRYLKCFGSKNIHLEVLGDLYNQEGENIGKFKYTLPENMYFLTDIYYVYKTIMPLSAEEMMAMLDMENSSPIKRAFDRKALYVMEEDFLYYVN